MKKVFILAIGSIFTLHVLPLAAVPPQAKVKSFLEWCQQKNSVSAATRTTIDRLLVKAGTEDCQRADVKLRTNTTSIQYLGPSTRERINGNGKIRPIIDLRPLAGLTNITKLVLYQTQVSDLSPLAGLVNLKTLEIKDSYITDLSPLAGLSNLERLDLSKNQIVDLSPLAGLSKLKSLTLDFNQIADFQPLAGLNNLKFLRLSHNKISSLQPLTGLRKLISVYLDNNPIGEKVCPKRVDFRCSF
jgi:internalin A